jgi:BirA family biotin operon repressor/biotin-[acetyl-CoA-carboxylase] ligase
MHIIKLNAIDSTNSYLKNLALNNTLDNFTVVTATSQIKGRGQLGTSWMSENGKNLTFSVLIDFPNFKISNQFYLSMACSLAVLKTVKMNVKVSTLVKWPNDILAEKDKIAGILIENSVSGRYIKQSIIGIGMNVNQTNFPKAIGNVTSLKNLAGTDFDTDELLHSILKNLYYFVHLIYNKEFVTLKEKYMNALYQYNKPAMFEDSIGEVFLGKIVDISEEGKLVIEIQNETTRKFSLKEIKFASRLH